MSPTAFFPLPSGKWGPRQSPTKWVCWGKEEQGSGPRATEGSPRQSGLCDDALRGPYFLLAQKVWRKMRQREGPLESPQIWGACFCGFPRQATARPWPSKNLLFFAARCLCSGFLVRSLGDFQGRTLEVRTTAFAAGSRANQTAAGRHSQRSAPQNEAAVLCGFTKGRALCWLFPPFLSTQKWGRRRRVLHYAVGKLPEGSSHPARGYRRTAPKTLSFRAGYSRLIWAMSSLISWRLEFLSAGH